MKLLFDYDPDNPQLTVRFDNFDDLLSFLVGFLELI